MSDAFLSAAGPVPGSSLASRWRQVALLGLARALDTSRPDAAVGLAATLCAMDLPHEALMALDGDDTPWGAWWRVIASGQAGDPNLGELIRDAMQVPYRGPDAREVRRRLADLDDERVALMDGASDDARFSLRGSDVGPPRRAFMVGRSSATFVLDPSWDGVRVIRLGPSDGPSGGNRAHLTRDEVVAQIRRGETGAGREVPPDTADELDPAALLAGLRGEEGARERQLLELAEDVRRERAELAGIRETLTAQRAKLRYALDEVKALRDREQAGVEVPTTATDAASVLGIQVNAAADTVEEAYRRHIQMCHPDRVSGMHPDIHARAEALTRAANAARDLLTNGVRPRRGRR